MLAPYQAHPLIVLLSHPWMQVLILHLQTADAPSDIHGMCLSCLSALAAWGSECSPRLPFPLLQSRGRAYIDDILFYFCVLRPFWLVLTPSLFTGARGVTKMIPKLSTDFKKSEEAANFHFCCLTSSLAFVVTTLIAILWSTIRYRVYFWTVYKLSLWLRYNSIGI